MQVIAASDSSLLVLFGEAISPELNYQVIDLFRKIQAWRDPRIRNLHPAYASLLVDFDPLALPHDELRSRIESCLADTRKLHPSEARRSVTIPVCYNGDFSPDLAEVARHTKLTPEEVIARHSAAEYTVYFLGFSPGFAYLGGLPPELTMPRLSTPRTRVPAGSVAIGGNQAGIYPMDSPGGWRLLGRTPLRIFDPEATPQSKLQPGDIVRFSPITREAFDSIVGNR